MTLRRNGMGQLGFHVRFEGLIADVEPSGFAWQAGLRQGCRLVEVCLFVIEDIRCFVHITIYVEVFFNYFSLKRRAFTACTSSCCENLNFLLFRCLIIKACKCSFYG